MANVRVAFQLHGHRDSMTASQWRSIRKQRSSGGDLKPLTTATSTDNPTSRDEIGYPPLPKKQKHGPKVLRIVGGWLARNRSGPGKKAFHSLEEPVSSVAVAQVTPQMSRANSLISRDNTEPETENEEEEIVDIGHRKRVSFDMDVMVSANSEIQTVIIQQMDKEDVRNTFYTRREFCAFKDAYRTHRDTPDWTRENDGLPCSCRSCSDDGRGVAESSPPPESPPVSPPSSLLLYSEDDRASKPSPVFHMRATRETVRLQSTNSNYGPREDEPPSPVGATVGDNEGLMSRPAARESGLDALVSRTQGGSHARKLSWEKGGVPSNVRQAVERYGVEHAYKRLRLQGFSDRYIRAHFLPEGPMIKP